VDDEAPMLPGGRPDVGLFWPAMINDADITRVTEACRALPEPVGDYLIDDYLTNLVATVVDFQTHSTAVERALLHFSTQCRPALDGLDLVELMRLFPADERGNTALAQHLWGYDLWTRAQMLRELVAYFSSIGVTDQARLRRWATDATFDEDFKGRVRGLGPAVFQWLVMRQGVDTVKPDVHLHRFATRAVGRVLSDADVVEVVVAAARELGRPAHRIDWAIWEAGRSGFSGGAAGSGEPPLLAQPDAVAVPRTRAQGWSGDPVSFLDNDIDYLAWTGANPAGYVLNSEREPSPRYLVLHRSTCYTMSPRGAADARTWTTAYRKTCATRVGSLVDWAIAHAGRPPAPCSRCRPEG